MKKAKNIIKKLDNQVNTPINIKTNNLISSSLKELIGIVKLPDNFDEKRELLGCFENKHGLLRLS